MYLFCADGFRDRGIPPRKASGITVRTRQLL